MPYSAIIQTPIGKLGILTSESALLRIEFLSRQKKLKAPMDALSKKVVKQIQTYFKDPKFQFDIPLALSVTPFQKKVLVALTKIPVGGVLSYGNLAQQLNTSARAIGNACRQNPVPLVIPCHRVVAKAGLGGYSGETQGTKFNIKATLLDHEGSVSVASSLF